MLSLALVDAARLASLASGRGGLPTAGEWPFVLALFALVAFLGARLLLSCGFTKLEAIAVAALAPALVLVDAPLGQASPTVSLWANAAGCIIPLAVSVKVILERRAPFLEAVALMLIGVVVSFLASHVVADRGVLLQYRAPAIVVGLAAAALVAARPRYAAGPLGFAGGAVGVVVGADLMHLQALASGGSAGRIILGGAGVLDGIFLVAILAAGIAELGLLALRAVLGAKTRSKSAA